MGVRSLAVGQDAGEQRPRYRCGGGILAEFCVAAFGVPDGAVVVAAARGWAVDDEFGPLEGVNGGSVEGPEVCLPGAVAVDVVVAAVHVEALDGELLGVAVEDEGVASAGGGEGSGGLDEEPVVAVVEGPKLVGDLAGVLATEVDGLAVVAA